MMAQIDIEPWHVYTGGLIAVLSVAVSLWIRVSNNKEEQRRAKAKDDREVRRDEEQTTLFRRMADSSEKHSVSIEALSQKLDKEQEIRELMHQNNLESQKHICRFRETCNT